MAYQPVLTSHINEPNSYTLDFYTKNQRGYAALTGCHLHVENKA